jgi:hypothetical protein
LRERREAGGLEGGTEEPSSGFGGVFVLTSGEASKMVGARSEENPDGGMRVEDRSEESPKMVVARSEGGIVDWKMR